jgi:hypothetical protein
LPSDNQIALIREAYRRSEKRLEAQLAIAIAFDQRSYVLAVVSIASAAYVMNEYTLGAGWQAGLIGASLFLTVSALLASLSALPQPMYTAGSKSEELRAVIDADQEEAAVILGLAKNNDRYIDSNDRSTNRRVAIYRLAVILFGAGLALIAISLSLPGITKG